MSSASRRNYHPTEHLKLMTELTGARAVMVTVVLNEECPWKHKHVTLGPQLAVLFGEVMGSLAQGSVPLGAGSESLKPFHFYFTPSGFAVSRVLPKPLDLAARTTVVMPPCHDRFISLWNHAHK